MLLYAAEKLHPSSAVTLSTEFLLYYYFKMYQAYSFLNKLGQSYVFLTPHTADPERVVSITMLKFKKQSGLSSRGSSLLLMALEQLFKVQDLLLQGSYRANQEGEQLPDRETYETNVFQKIFY